MELKILDWIQALHNPVTDVLFVWITRLGNVGMIWILLAAVLLLRRKTRKTGDILAAALYLTGERRLWKPALVLGVLIAFSWLSVCALPVRYPGRGARRSLCRMGRQPDRGKAAEMLPGACPHVCPRKT